MNFHFDTKQEKNLLIMIRSRKENLLKLEKIYSRRNVFKTWIVNTTYSFNSFGEYQMIEKLKKWNFNYTWKVSSD